MITQPNLIANDIFITKPMTSFQGYLNYMQYTLGTSKNGVGESTVIQDPFTYGAMTEDRMNYSGELAWDQNTGESAATVTLGWTPILKEQFVSGTTKYDVKIVASNGTVSYANATVDASTGVTTVASVAAGAKVYYKYDNKVIPQEQIPSIKAHMEGIELRARARRLKIAYSQFAAYIAKQDYGHNLETQIAQQAQAELQYEIDSEAIFLIKNAADGLSDAARTLTWEDEELDTISYSMKAEGFARKIAQAKAGVYKANGRFMPNWMIVSPDVLPILAFVPGFKATTKVVNGPYLAGNLDGMKIYVSPAIGEKVCYLGVIGNDGVTGVGVYAPYMPLVPTQLLGYADGTMEQGFSTMYDMKILNTALLAKITITAGDDAALYKELSI